MKDGFLCDVHFADIEGTKQTYTAILPKIPAVGDVLCIRGEATVTKVVLKAYWVQDANRPDLQPFEGIHAATIYIEH